MPDSWREVSVKRVPYILVLGLALMAQPVKADAIGYTFNEMPVGEDEWNGATPAEGPAGVAKAAAVVHHT